MPLNVRRLSFCLVALVLCLAEEDAQATTLVRESFGDLVAKAEAVLVGTVVAQSAKRGPDGEIYTFITLSQLLIVKGTYAGKQITLRQAGGVLGDEHLVLVGSPNFATNDRVAVFVRGNGSQMVPYVGWTQGVFRFVADATGRRVVLDHEGNTVYGVEDDEVQKEHKHAPAAEIVDRRSMVMSSAQNVGGPITGPAARERTSDSPSAAGARAPMSADAFVSAIQAQLKESVTSAGPVASVDDFGGVRGSSRVFAPTGPLATAGVSAETSPSAEPQLPSRAPAPPPVVDRQ